MIFYQWLSPWTAKEKVQKGKMFQCYDCLLAYVANKDKQKKFSFATVA